MVIIEGKYCSLETEDYGKGQAIVDYLNWALDKPEFKAECLRQRCNLINYGTTDIRWPLQAPTEARGAFLEGESWGSSSNE